MSYQVTIAVGNLGGEPEMRYTPSGQAVTSFSVATNKEYTGSDGKKVKETVWLRVQTWGKMAEACNQYLHKGSKVLVEGGLIADKTTGSPKIWSGQDGKPRASFEINASVVKFLDSKNDADPRQDGDIPQDIF
jgi:single-strand DNA-binding protein